MTVCTHELGEFQRLVCVILFCSSLGKTGGCGEKARKDTPSKSEPITVDDDDDDDDYVLKSFFPPIEHQFLVLVCLGTDIQWLLFILLS